MPGEQRPRRVRMDADERRREILDAANELFRTRSYADVSVSDIAEAAGVARGLLHHYFSSKRELYLEIVRESVRLPPVPGDEDPDYVWPRGIDYFITAIKADADHWLETVGATGPSQDDDVREIVEASREFLARRTIESIGLGGNESPTLLALVRGYGGLVQEVTVEWLFRGRLTEDQVRTILATTLPVLVEQILPLIDADHA